MRPPASRPEPAQAGAARRPREVILLAGAVAGRLARASRGLGLAPVRASDGAGALAALLAHEHLLVVADASLLAGAPDLAAMVEMAGYGASLVVIGGKRGQAAVGAPTCLARPDARRLRRLVRQRRTYVHRLVTRDAAFRAQWREVMGDGRRSLCEGIEVLAQAITCGDAEQAARVVHRIKGSAASFGQPELSRLAAHAHKAFDAGATAQAFDRSRDLVAHARQLP